MSFNQYSSPYTHSQISISTIEKVGEWLERKMVKIWLRLTDRSRKFGRKSKILIHW